MNPDKTLDDAIAFAAERWQQAMADGSVPPNTNLRDRVTIFATPFRKALLARFPDLRAADEQVLLLIVAEGVARSGTVERGKVERGLGIILPPDL
jgi:hypothetical protein